LLNFDFIATTKLFYKMDCQIFILADVAVATKRRTDNVWERVLNTFPENQKFSLHVSILS